MAAIAAGGFLLGTFLADASSAAALGTLAVLVAGGVTLLRPAFGLAMLVFTYPFDLTTRAGPLKLTTSAALIVILVIAWAIRQVLANPAPWRATSLDLPVLLFSGATALSLAGLNGHLDEQLIGLLKALGGVLVFFLATQSIENSRDVWLVAGAALAAGLLQASGTTFDVLSGHHVVSEATRATGSLVQPNLFAGYLVLLIPLLVAIGIAVRPRWLTGPTAIGTLILLIALVATLSRSAWLGLVAGALLLGMLVPQRRWRLAAVIATVTAVLVLAGLAGPIGARLSPHTEGPLEMLVGRWNIWTAAVAMAIQHPLFGVGVGNFQNFYPTYSGHRFGVNHAHNLFLNIAAERGLPAFLVFGALLISLFRVLAATLGRTLTTLEQALVAGLAATFLAYFVHSWFEVSYYDYKVLLLFWLLVGIAVTLPTVLTPSPQEADAMPLAGSLRLGLPARSETPHGRE